ncbi:MAG: hypothetical protein EAZ61_10590 [Oscillatoriales cyanobacterium]|nr:MAG: hypothetical protein EAZ61_10590 [Oscillatoriales cyanobacterium]
MDGRTTPLLRFHFSATSPHLSRLIPALHPPRDQNWGVTMPEDATPPRVDRASTGFGVVRSHSVDRDDLP